MIILLHREGGPYQKQRKNGLVLLRNLGIGSYAKLQAKFLPILHFANTVAANLSVYRTIGNVVNAVSLLSRSCRRPLLKRLKLSFASKPW